MFHPHLKQKLIDLQMTFMHALNIPQRRQRLPKRSLNATNAFIDPLFHELYNQIIINMKSVLLAILVYLTASMQLRTHLDDHIVGGFSGRKVSSVNDLDADEKKAYNFIDENIDLSEYKLVSTEHQVVAGMNYCFVFRPINQNKGTAKKKAGVSEDT